MITINNCCDCMPLHKPSTFALLYTCLQAIVVITDNYIITTCESQFNTDISIVMLVYTCMHMYVRMSKNCLIK